MRRNILSTGASAGLGAEMARQFAAKGHNLALTARREERLKALRSELTARLIVSMARASSLPARPSTSFVCVIPGPCCRPRMMHNPSL